MLARSPDQLYRCIQTFLALVRTDPAQPLAKRTIRLLLRFTWELPQTIAGYLYAQLRNSIGKTDHVIGFGNATYVAHSDTRRRTGVSLGCFIVLELSCPDREIEAALQRDPLPMHEYGHTFDSLRFGPLYLLIVGIPSLWSAMRNRPDARRGGYTHDRFWTELRANRDAADYFGRRGIDWTRFERPGPSGFFPRSKAGIK